MGAGASFESAEAAIKAGHSAEEVEAYMVQASSQEKEKEIEEEMEEEDPWASFDVEMQWKRINESDYKIVVCDEDVSCEERGDDVVAHLSTLIPGADGMEDEAYGIAAADLDVTVVEWNSDSSDSSKGECLLPGVVALDLSGNQISTLSLNTTPHLRLLNLSGNSGFSLAALQQSLQADPITRLLSLDLSFIDLGPRGGDIPWASSMPCLRSANLEDCELVAVPALPVSLLTLNLSDNNLCTAASLSTLSRLVSLVDLDCRSNEVREGSQRIYSATVRAALPALRRLDNAVLVLAVPCAGTGKPTCGRLAAFATIDGLQAAVGSTDTVADRMEKAMFADSCSCTSGVACSNRYACKNWEKRHEVARLGRKKYGVRNVNNEMEGFP